MLLVARSVIEAALLRDESRGPHLRFASEADRAPLPRREDEWSRYIVLSMPDRDIITETKEPVRPVR
jgi:succinate dehydrogenase / fumarate reductase flavoprotein subunit